MFQGISTFLVVCTLIARSRNNVHHPGTKDNNIYYVYIMCKSTGDLTRNNRWETLYNGSSLMKMDSLANHWSRYWLCCFLLLDFQETAKTRPSENNILGHILMSRFIQGLWWFSERRRSNTDVWCEKTQSLTPKIVFEWLTSYIPLYIVWIGRSLTWTPTVTGRFTYCPDRG